MKVGRIIILFVISLLIIACGGENKTEKNDKNQVKEDFYWELSGESTVQVKNPKSIKEYESFKFELNHYNSYGPYTDLTFQVKIINMDNKEVMFDWEYLSMVNEYLYINGEDKTELKKVKNLAQVLNEETPWEADFEGEFYLPKGKFQFLIKTYDEKHSQINDYTIEDCIIEVK